MIDKVLTHKDLVKKGAAWLRNSKNCTVVFSELSTINTETPDCIGFHSSGGRSVLIECKASRSDFLADKKKSFRRNAFMGMGDIRYFMAPTGMLKSEEIPEPWGLIEVRETSNHGVRAKVVKEAANVEEVNKSAEVTMLVSVLRRLEISTAVFVRQEEV